MAVNIEQMLWFQSDTSDKIWGIANHNNSLYTFWCRRNASVKVKYMGHNMDLYHLKSMIREKKDKGYQDVDERQQRKIDPMLAERLEQAVVMSSLKNQG